MQRDRTAWQVSSPQVQRHYTRACIGSEGASPMDSTMRATHALVDMMRVVTVMPIWARNWHDSDDDRPTEAVWFCLTHPKKYGPSEPRRTVILSAYTFQDSNP